METFFEWKNKNIEMSFSEKYNMLIQRLSTLQMMKSTADAAKGKPGIMVGVSLGCYGCGGENKSVEEICREVDLMWNELKEDIKSSIKDKGSREDEQTTR